MSQDSSAQGRRVPASHQRKPRSTGTLTEKPVTSDLFPSPFAPVPRRLTREGPLNRFNNTASIFSSKSRILVKHPNSVELEGGVKKTVFSLFLPLGYFKLLSERDLLAGAGAPAPFLGSMGSAFCATGARPCICFRGPPQRPCRRLTPGEGQTGLAEAEPPRWRKALTRMSRLATCSRRSSASSSSSRPSRAQPQPRGIQTRFGKLVLGEADKQRSCTGQPGSRRFGESTALALNQAGSMPGFATH